MNKNRASHIFDLGIIILKGVNDYGKILHRLQKMDSGRLQRLPKLQQFATTPAVAAVHASPVAAD